MTPLTHQYILSIFKPRPSENHKGNNGHSLIIAGQKMMMGGAIIASKACLRAGTGLLTLCIPEEERFIAQTTIPEAMLCRREIENIDFSKFNAIGIGPALGLNNESFLVEVCNNATCNLVLDADALNIIANNKSLLGILPENSILTPHPKEFDRIFGLHLTHEDRIETAISVAKQLNIIIVLKNFKTIVISNDLISINTTGNAGLAKCGSGDALTGIITALLAQKYTTYEAAQLGVYLHGLAADICLNADQSTESMLISDIIDNLGGAFKTLYK